LRYYKYLSNSQFKLHTDPIFNHKKQSFEANLFMKSSKVYSDYQELINYVNLVFLSSIMIKEPSKYESPNLIQKLKEFQIQKGKLSSSSNAFPALELVANLVQNKVFYEIIKKSKVLDAANTNKHSLKQIDFNEDIVIKAIQGYNNLIEVLSLDSRSIVTKKCLINSNLKVEKAKIVIKESSSHLLLKKINSNIEIVSDIVENIERYNDVKDILRAMKQINDFRGIITRHQELTGQVFNNKNISVFSIDQSLKKLKNRKAKLKTEISKKYNQTLSTTYNNKSTANNKKVDKVTQTHKFIQFIKRMFKR